MSAEKPRPQPVGDNILSGDPSSDRLQLTNLVKQYFNVCNTALGRGTGGPLYQTLLGFLNEFATGETITLQITGTGEDHPPSYTTRFVDGQFMPVREGTHVPDTRFTLSREFLEDVARNAEHYIRNPEDLDWSWLRGKRT